MGKKVSIILSTYNEALVIEDTINQIFNTLDDVEVILVDDNSTDGTFEIDYQKVAGNLWGNAVAAVRAGRG